MVVLYSHVASQSEAAGMDPCSLLLHQSGAADVPSWSLGDGPEVAPSVLVNFDLA